MANNTEQDKMDILIRELYTLSAQDIEPHHFAVKARQLIEAEATRARLDEAIYWQTSINDEETGKARIAELKRQAEGGK